MVTGNIAGDVAIWDLDKRQVLHVMKGAHEGTVHSAHYFSGQPILITAGSDNALRVRKKSNLVTPIHTSSNSPLSNGSSTAPKEFPDFSVHEEGTAIHQPASDTIPSTIHRSLVPGMIRLCACFLLRGIRRVWRCLLGIRRGRDLLGMM